MLDQADDKVPTNTAGLRRWPIGFAARSATLGLVAATLMTAAAAQSVTTMYGYSRATLSGIPGDPRGAQGSSVFPPRYYLYVEVKPGSTVSARWAWVGGAYYDCTLKKVSTPVQVESVPGVPTDTKETLVPKTSSDVYNVVLGEVTTRVSANGQEKELIAGNEAVIAFSVNKSPAYAAIPTIKALRPAAAM